VTVTDYCGTPDTKTIRNIGGQWTLIGGPYTATNNCANNTLAGGCAGGIVPEYVVGEKRWTLQPVTKNTVSADCSCAGDSGNWDSSWSGSGYPSMSPYNFWYTYVYPYGSDCDCDETQVPDYFRGYYYEWGC
jgi:hypothetical protein